MTQMVPVQQSSAEAQPIIRSTRDASRSAIALSDASRDSITRANSDDACESLSHHMLRCELVHLIHLRGGSGQIEADLEADPSGAILDSAVCSDTEPIGTAGTGSVTTAG